MFLDLEKPMPENSCTIVRRKREARQLTNPHIRRSANNGDPYARVLIFRHTASEERRACLLERWGMIETLQFDCHGEPMFA